MTRDRKSTRLNSSHGSISYAVLDRKSTRLNSSHGSISYAVFCLKNTNKDPVCASLSFCALFNDPEPTEIVPGVLTCVFFFNDTATTEIYPLSLHDAIPICGPGQISLPIQSLEGPGGQDRCQDRKSTRLNSSHGSISYAVFCLKNNRHAQQQLSTDPRRPVADAHTLSKPAP